MTGLRCLAHRRPGDDFGDGSKSNPFHVVIDSDNPEDGDAPQITDPVIDNGGYSGGGGGGNSTSDSSSEKILHKPQVLLEDSNLSGGRLEAGSTTEMSLTFRNKSCSQNVFGLKISLSTENKGIEFEKNSFYVQVLAPGEAITLEQMITITENCDPGQAVITFSLDYEDSKATATTGTELLSFQIIQPVRVKLEASDIPSVLYTMDVMAHHTYLNGEIWSAYGMGKAALFMADRSYPISMTYIHCMMAVCAINRKHKQEAQEEMLRSWELAKMDGFLEPFIEHHGLLRGLIEACIRNRDPEAYQRITEGVISFSRGWMALHNPENRRKVTGELSTMEFSIAMLASGGWTNKEIGEHLGISINTVKHYLTDIFCKLNVKKRDELKKFMLK